MQDKHRYPGVNSFNESDQDVFHGRGDDIEYIYNSILLNQCVVIFGKSGVGKSSILRAGIIPKILATINDKKSENNNFRIYNIRPGLYLEPEKLRLTDKLRVLNFDSGINTHPQQLFLSFLPEKIKKSLWYQFKSFQYNITSKAKKETYLMIIDQVEELFTYPREHFDEMIREIVDVRSQMLPVEARVAVEHRERKEKLMLSPTENEVLYSPIPIKFIFAIRSDKLHLINRLKKAIPGILQNTYELLPLSELQALNALTSPCKKPGKYASPKFDLSSVTGTIIKFLKSQPNNELELSDKEYCIEPFAMQLICQHIEQNVVIKLKIRKVTDDILGDLDAVFRNFYLQTLEALDLNARTIFKVRKLIEEKLIYEKDRRRISLYRSKILEDLGIDEKAFDIIIGSKILKETAPGTNAFEISHDSLLIPILHAKAERLETEIELNKKYDASSRNITKEFDIVGIEKDIKKNPYNFELYKRKAEYYYTIQRFDEALGAYNKAIELLDVVNEDLLIGRSNCYFALKQYEKSNDDLLEVIKLNPSSEIALLNVGFNFFKLEKFDEAILYYKRALEVSSGSVEANYNLALLYKGQADFEAAATHFNRALIGHADDMVVFLELLDVYIALQRGLEQKTCIEKLLGASTALGDTYYKIGDLYLNRYLYEDAIHYFSAAIKYDQYNASYHAGISICYSYLGDMDQAVGHFELACKYQPRNAFYHTWLGFLYERMSNRKKALEHFQAAVLYDPSYRYPWAALGACYRRLGNDLAYRENIEKARSLLPADSEDEYSNASFEALCGNKEQALIFLADSLSKRQRSPEFAELDPDFEFIRLDPKFLLLIEKAKEDLLTNQT